MCRCSFFLLVLFFLGLITNKKQHNSKICTVLHIPFGIYLQIPIPIDTDTHRYRYPLDPASMWSCIYNIEDEDGPFQRLPPVHTHKYNPSTSNGAYPYIHALTSPMTHQIQGPIWTSSPCTSPDSYGHAGPRPRYVPRLTLSGLPPITRSIRSAHLQIL